MFKSYILIALRNLLRHRTFSLINILGLALSMSVCLLIIMLVRDAYSFDNFHPDSEKVFRLITEAQRKDGRTEPYATSPFPVAAALEEMEPQVEVWTPLVRQLFSSIRIEQGSVPIAGFFTNETFFETFGFRLRLGNSQTALDDPYSLILNHEVAEAIFPDENPLGKTLTLSGYDTEFKVTGILEPFAGKTHLEFNALSSLPTLVVLERDPETHRVTDNWQNYYSTYSFFRLQSASAQGSVESALQEVSNNFYADLKLETRDAGYRFTLQPLEDITPGGLLSNAMGSGMPIFLIWFLSALGVIIMFCACFNYMNLTIARALSRMREVGVRKVLGAHRMQIFWQFIGEAMVTSVLALGVGYLMMKWVKPQFERLSLVEVLDIRINEDIWLYVIFIAFALGVGLFAGLLPALTLSGTKPVTVLQKLQDIRLIRRFGMRKTLLTLQFAFTLIFLIVMTVSWRQVGHAVVTNFGFNQPNMLLVQLQGQPFEKASAALARVSGVEGLSGISFPMGTWRDGSADVRMDAAAEKVEVRDYAIDHRYLPHFNLPLAAGRNFAENPSQQREHAVIVNEMFVRHFNLGESADAIGASMILGDSTQVSIIGVARNFPFKPATYALEPLLLRYQPDQLDVLNLTVAGGNTPAVVASLEKAWKELDTGLPFRGEFFDETVRGNYSEMLDLTRIVGFFGFLGMVIACMGLLGMAIYIVESKAKEISIRKVLGANVRDVVVYLSKGYVILFLIAIVLAAPVAYLLSNQFLQQFAERISWGPGLFLPGIVVLLIAACSTIGWQTLRAAMADPVENLRSE